MFRAAKNTARDPLLPTSNNGRRGGESLYGPARRSRPNISKSFIATVLWALASLGLIRWGWLFCIRRLEASAFSCNHFMCKLEETRGGITEVLTIPRARLVRGDMVRVKNGEIVPDALKLKRSAQKKLGYSYAIVYTEPDSEDDDDESYDSYEDDDDSYDSYDDNQDSSEDDERTVIPPRQRTPPGKAGGGAGVAPRVAAEEKRAAARKREEERARYSRERDDERRKKGMPPIREPDEPSAAARKISRETLRAEEEDDDERFPGDAGTMRQKHNDQLKRMGETRGKSAREQAEAHRARYNRDEVATPPTAAMMNAAKADIEARSRARRTSPDDPDNKMPPSKVEDAAPEAEKEKTAENIPDIEEIKNQERQDIENLEKGNLERRNGGGREISSVGGLESLQDLDILEDEGIHRRGPGGRRKLLAIQKKKQPSKRDHSSSSNRRTRREIEEDARIVRDVHRKGHGHHNKRARNVAHPKTLEEEEAEELGKAIPPQGNAVHHHKGFHHSDKAFVPKEERNHVHHGFHHRPGDEKVKGGWRHQDRQWHEHGKLRRLGARYSLGRSKARKRKEAIDKYAKKNTHNVEFKDSKMWSARGICIMIVGCISAAFCLVVGNFQPIVKSKKLS